MSSYDELYAYAALVGVSPEQIRATVEQGTAALRLHYETVSASIMDVIQIGWNEERAKRYAIEQGVESMKRRKVHHGVR